MYISKSRVDVIALLISLYLYNKTVIEYTTTYYLKSPHYATGVHAGGHIHSIAPDVILGLLRADNSCNHRSMVKTNA